MIQIEFSNDMTCPKCHSNSTKKLRTRLFKGAGELFLAVFLLEFFGTNYPILIVITMVLLVLRVFVNLVYWIKYRNYWEMECSRCNTKFYTIDPDKVQKDALKSKNDLGCEKLPMNEIEKFFKW